MRSDCRAAMVSPRRWAWASAACSLAASRCSALYTLLATVEWLYVGLKVAGGLYLIYLASKIWRGAAKPLAFDAAQAAYHQCAQIVLDRLEHTTQQSENSRLLRQHFRGACFRNIRRCGVTLPCRRRSSPLRPAGTRSSHCAFRANGRAKSICSGKPGSIASPQAPLPRSDCV